MERPADLFLSPPRADNAVSSRRGPTTRDHGGGGPRGGRGGARALPGGPGGLAQARPVAGHRSRSRGRAHDRGRAARALPRSRSARRGAGRVGPSRPALHHRPDRRHPELRTAHPHVGGAHRSRGRRRGDRGRGLPAGFRRAAHRLARAGGVARRPADPRVAGGRARSGAGRPLVGELPAPEPILGGLPRPRRTHPGPARLRRLLRLPLGGRGPGGDRALHHRQGLGRRRPEGPRGRGGRSAHRSRRPVRDPRHHRAGQQRAAP
jgi:hypothetical protein